jgi:3-oxoacyl-[acyl-carrier-protein] synthase II
MTQRRVAITGLGIISPYGGDLPDFFARLLAGESAVHFLHTDDIPRPLAIPFVSCHGFNPDEALGRPLAGMMDRFAQLGTAAAFNAWADAGLSRGEPAQGRK